MSLRPLTPQSPARVDWEQSVCAILESILDCPTSDAQGIMDVQHETLDRCFRLQVSALEAAKAVDKASDAMTASLGADIQLDDPIRTAPGESLVQSVAAARIPSPMGMEHRSAGEVIALTFIGMGAAALLHRCNSLPVDQFGILARRLVASENACNGIDLDTLETWGAGGVLTATNTLGEANAALGRAIEQLTLERDAVGRANVRLTAAQALAARTIEQLRMDLEAANTKVKTLQALAGDLGKELQHVHRYLRKNGHDMTAIDAVLALLTAESN